MVKFPTCHVCGAQAFVVASVEDFVLVWALVFGLDWWCVFGAPQPTTNIRAVSKIANFLARITYYLFIT